MAQKAIIHKVELSVSDMGRHDYETHKLIVAKHTSETDEQFEFLNGARLLQMWCATDCFGQSARHSGFLDEGVPRAVRVPLISKSGKLTLSAAWTKVRCAGRSVVSPGVH